MLFRLKESVRNLIIRLFMAKKNDLSAMTECVFSPEGYDKSYIVNSSIVTRYDRDGESRFFRECREHKKLKDYIFDSVDDYFANVCKSKNKEELRLAARKDLSVKTNYRRMTRITSVFNLHLMDILRGSYDDCNSVGIPSFKKAGTQEDFIAFIKFMCCIVISHGINAHTRYGVCENGNANKQLATYRLACYLGVGRLIPRVDICKLADGEDERIGTLMEKAPGEPPSEIMPEDRYNYSASFVRDLTTLELFDFLCYQLDHRLDNYHIIKDDSGVISGVVAFDNDAGRTFFVSGKLPKATYAGATAVVGGKGEFLRPFVDESFAKRLAAVTKRELIEQVGMYMSRIQLNCLWSRIRCMRSAINKSEKRRMCELVRDWAAADPKRELGNEYGCTYFKLYLEDTVMLDRQKAFAEASPNNNQ